MAPPPRDASLRVQPGFSGSPVYDDEAGAVGGASGEVSHSDRRPARRRRRQDRDVLPVRQPRRKRLRGPAAFDIGRDPNPHIGFGGGGPHHCLGAHLAQIELRVLFDVLADRPSVAATAGRFLLTVSAGIIASPSLQL